MEFVIWYLIGLVGMAATIYSYAKLHRTGHVELDVAETLIALFFGIGGPLTFAAALIVILVWATDKYRVTFNKVIIRVKAGD